VTDQNSVVIMIGHMKSLRHQGVDYL